MYVVSDEARRHVCYCFVSVSHLCLQYSVFVTVHLIDLTWLTRNSGGLVKLAKVVSTELGICHSGNLQSHEGSTFFLDAKVQFSRDIIGCHVPWHISPVFDLRSTRRSILIKYLCPIK